MENYLIYISDENSLLTVNLEDKFLVKQTCVELVCHFSIYRNIICVICSDRTIQKFKIGDSAELSLIKVTTVEKSKKYTFHTICKF